MIISSHTQIMFEFCCGFNLLLYVLLILWIILCVCSPLFEWRDDDLKQFARVLPLAANVQVIGLVGNASLTEEGYSALGDALRDERNGVLDGGDIQH